MRSGVQGWLGDFLEAGVCLALDERRLLVGWGEWQWAEKPAEDRISFYAPDFYLESPTPWLIPGLSTIMTREDLLGVLPTQESHALGWEPPSRDAFAATFGAIHDGVTKGRLVKAVPVAFETARGAMTPTTIGSSLRKLLDVADGARVYGAWDSDGGMIGRSPEVLFSTSEGRLHSMALAGTRRRSDDEWTDPKEIHEHEVVVQDLKNTLAAFGAVTTGPREVLSLSTLQHFRTPLEVALERSADFASLARALHPTAALGVYPRNFGWHRLKDWDGAGDRGRFGAPFGARQADGSGICLVAIRNLQWRGDALSVGAGCGIVRDSQLDREWAELALKRSAVKGWLGL